MKATDALIEKIDIFDADPRKKLVTEAGILSVNAGVRSQPLSVRIEPFKDAFHQLSPCAGRLNVFNSKSQVN